MLVLVGWNVQAQNAPVGSVIAPQSVALGDTMTAVFNITHGQYPMSYTWHSAMLDTLADTGTVVHLLYNMAGWDTLTATATNAYGSVTSQAIVRVHNCGTVTTLPWKEDFSGMDTAYYAECWTISNWEHWHSNYIMTLNNEDRVLTEYPQLMMCSDGSGKYLLSPPISIPTEYDERLRLWVEGYNIPKICISPTASLDTADYTDTLNPGEPTLSRVEWRLFDLSAYSGQTIRVGLFSYNSSIFYLNSVRIDYDTLPVLLYESLQVPSSTSTNSQTLCIGGLSRGSRTGLTYTWHSSLLNNTFVGDSVLLYYPIDGSDTITVIATNIYGSDTLSFVISVIDCSTQTTLPWRETFNHGLVCWQKLFGNWTEFSYLFSGITIKSSPDSVDRWLVSKPISLPEDTAYQLRLFWKAAAGSYIALRYSVLVSTSSDPTDTSAYTLIYQDTNQLAYINYASPHYTERSVDLASFAGETVHIAFRNETQGSDINNYYYDFYLGCVEVRSMAAPSISVSANGTYYHGDTATFTATLLDGNRNGLSYSWHSSLLDSTFVGDSILRICYGMLSGTDTMTVIAYNPYGSDTATICVQSVIINLPEVSMTEYTEFILGDTLVYTASLNHCVLDGLVWMWHSTLLNQWSSAIGEWPVYYTAEGIDTVTLIVSNCFGADTVENVVEVIDCSPRTLPWTEDFEGVETGGVNTARLLPRCWDMIWNAGNAEHAPRIVDHYTGIGFIPNNALLMEAGNKTNYRASAEVILPRMAANLENLAIAFDYRNAYYPNGILRVGYRGATGGFVTVENLPGHSGSYCRDTVFFSATSVTDPDARIVLRWFYNQVDSYEGLVIDNIEVFFDSISILPPCASLLGAEVSVMSDTSVEISWDYDMNSAFPPEGVLINLHDLTSGANTAFVAHGSDTMLTRLPLSHNFRADIRVLCGSDTSDAAALFFSTPDLPDTVWRTVSITEDPEGVCETYGSGIYADSSIVQIGYYTVDTNTYGGHWSFIGWSDGDTSNPRDILVISDTVIVAHFEWVADSATEEITQTGIPSLSIYPNPAHDFVVATIHSETAKQISFFDMHGRSVLSVATQDALSSDAFSIDVSNLPRGIYFVRFDGIGEVKKLVLQ